MGHTDQETTLALLIASCVLAVLFILYCVFKDVYSCITCPFRCVGSTYKRCCPASAGYKTQEVSI